MQTVEVRLAPAGSILATVLEGDKPLPGATLVFAPDSAAPRDLLLGSALRQARAGQDGKAPVPSLLPGVYRMIAYPPGAPWADDPALPERLRNAQRVEVTAGEQKVVDVPALAAR
jgi:hypothetical protein